MITIDDIKKVDVRVGTVISAVRVPDTDKLLQLMVDFGLKPSTKTEGSPDHPSVADGAGEERDIRQIISGIAQYVPEPETLVGRQLSFIVNLEPRTIKGLESNGMLFATGSGDTFAFLVPDRIVPPGTSAH